MEVGDRLVAHAERSCTGENARIHEASCQRPFAAREYDRETRKAGVGLWVRSTAV